MRSGIITVAVLTATLLAVPANAQYGRIVQPSSVTDLHETACRANAADLAVRVPRLAAARKWDEYGLSAKARPGDRAWLVAIAGQPTIVDISREGPKQRCSVSAVTAPSSILRIVRAQLGRAPDRVMKQGTQANVSIWRLSPGQSISVTVPNGPALGRITLETTR